MKAILGFTRMSVRGIDKAKRELGFVLMALNIRKVTAQRAENNQKNNKKDNFYIISIEIVFFYLSWDFMSHTHLNINYLFLTMLSASPNILRLISSPVGVPAKPPNPVSLNDAGKLRPTLSLSLIHI